MYNGGQTTETVTPDGTMLYNIGAASNTGTLPTGDVRRTSSSSRSSLGLAGYAVRRSLSLLPTIVFLFKTYDISGNCSDFLNGLFQRWDQLLDGRLCGGESLNLNNLSY